MATGEQIKNLIKAHYEQNEEHFRSAALRIAASEAKNGHAKLAREIKHALDSSDQSRYRIINFANREGLFNVTYPENSIDELVVPKELQFKLSRILREYSNREKLASYGLSSRRKLLLEGPPGTGKTMTASVLASSLSLPLSTVQVDKLITKYLGETSTKLRQIFSTISSNRAVYFFDEFDAIGADRNYDNEVGEMRRILNSFLQFIESDSSNSLIIAATNNRKMLDQALFRRFDDVLHYDLPSVEEIRSIVNQRTGAFSSTFSLSNSAAKAMLGLCQAEIARLCDDAIKECLLNETSLSNELFSMLVADRLLIYSDQRIS